MTESKFGTKSVGGATGANSSRHIPVLLHEVLESLNLRDGDIFVDGTLGGAGHSAAIAEALGEGIEIIGIDRDAEALKRSEERLLPLTSNFYLRQASFRNIDRVLGDLGVTEANAILLDLGISSDQLDDSGRGFSFQRNEPLDMRMSSDGISAAEVLNNWSEETLEMILRGFGEERYAKRIANEIAARRLNKPFETTHELVEAVRAATPANYHRGRIHPATRTFQAIRIAVNEELNVLEEGLAKAFDALASGGRLAVISFHSLEDRIVKNFFRNKVKEGGAKLVTKKPLTASESEVEANPRSRSAKLRVLEKI